MTPAGRRRVVKVLVDRDLGDADVATEPTDPLTLDEVADATRVVSDALDAGDLMGEQPYTLEVSSPGVGRPLTEPRHFRRNVGRLVTGQPRRPRGHRPRACSAGGTEVTLEVPATRSTPARTETLPYAGLERAAVQVEFARTGRTRTADMDIDLAALRALERERDISLDVLIPAIEQAMCLAYHRTEGHYRTSRVELDRKTGHVVVWAREEGEIPAEEGEVDDEGNPARPRREPGPEFDDTPAGFGRIAAATARQVIVQRLRDIEDDAILGDFRGREGDVVAGVIQQSRDPRNVLGRLRQRRGRPARWPSRCRASSTSTASGCAATSSSVKRGHARPADRAVAHAPQPRAQALRARGPRDRRRQRRDRGAGPRGRAPHQDRGAHHGARASTPRAPASARWARGCGPS